MAIIVNYSEIDAQLANILTAMDAIQSAVDKGVQRESYDGVANDVFQGYLDDINAALGSMVPELKKMHDKVSEIKTEYAEREAALKTALTKKGGESSPNSSSNGSNSSRANRTN